MTALKVSGSTLATVNGRLQLVTGVEEIAQKLDVSLSLFWNEWVLNAEAGVQWFERVFVKNPNLGELQLFFRKAILEVPGIRTIETLTLDLDTATRALTITIKCKTVTDEVIDFNKTFAPFATGTVV